MALTVMPLAAPSWASALVKPWMPDLADAAEIARQHAFPDGFAHVEATAEIGIQDLIPIHAAHLAHGPVARDPGIVDEDFDRPEFICDRAYGGDAGIEIRHVPLPRDNPGLTAENVRLGHIGRIIGEDQTAGILERNGNGSANAAGSSGNDSDARHDSSVIYRSTQTAMPMPPPMHIVAIPFFALRRCIS